MQGVDPAEGGGDVEGDAEDARGERLEPRGEREVAGVWLRSVAAHLRDPAAMAGHAAALTEAALMDRAASARFQQE